MNKTSKWIKTVSYIFSAAGYHSGNDSAENSKYIWKTYGIKKSFCDLYRQTLFQFNIKFITNINLKMLTYQFYSTLTTNVLYYYLLQSVQTSSYIYMYLDSSWGKQQVWRITIQMPRKIYFEKKTWWTFNFTSL